MNWSTVLASIRRAHGEPLLNATFKQNPEDFVVEELLGFEPDGDGEHELVQVEKKGVSTLEAQLQLAKVYRLPLKDISFAGMKDRQAIARQWFSVRVGIKAPSPDFNRMDGSVRILDRARNRRKLQRGSHRGNRFLITLRECDAASNRSAIEARLQDLGLRGVPNYFGMQRFGRNGDNLAQVADWFAGRSLAPASRTLRGLLLSSARSLLFNAVLSERVRAGTWNQILAGELVALSGSERTFASSRATLSELQERLNVFDIHPTGPLWGCGDPGVGDEVKTLESSVAGQYREFYEGLEREGLEHQRRALRVQVCNLQFDWQGNDLQLSFMLARGAYATSVLRELLFDQTLLPLSAGEVA